MVKSCQAEDAVQAHWDTLLRQRATAEAGVVVGKAGVGSRDLVLTVIKTPDQDGLPVASMSAAAAAAAASAGPKPKKGGARSASGAPPAAAALSLEGEWLSEHCVQVARMLPGGLAVLGVYLYAPEGCWAAATATLCAALRAVSEHAAAARAGAPPPPPPQLLVLFVDASSRKQSLRVTSGGAAAAPSASSLAPAELKYGAWSSALVCLRCRYRVDVRLPAAPAAAQLSRLASDAVAAEARALASAAATICGRVPCADAQLGDLVPSDAGGGPVEVALYPAVGAAPGGGGGGGGAWPRVEAVKAAGEARLRGEVAGIAYAHRRESVAAALAALKADLVHSLVVRVELLTEEALNAAEEAAEAAEEQEEKGRAGDAGGGGGGGAAPPALLATAGTSPAASLALPSRALLPWVGGLQACDHLTAGEGVEEAGARASELLGLDAGAAGAAVAAEAPAAVGQPSPVAAAPAAGGAAQARGRQVNACVAAGAVAALAAAVAVGYLSLSVDK